MKKTISITGDGSWATALAWVLTKNGHHVTWHIRTPEVYESLTRHGFNSEYLRFTRFNGNRPDYTRSLTEAIEASEKLLVVIPAAFIRSSFQDVSPALMKDKQIISATKGLLPGLHITPCMFFGQEYGIPSERLVFVSGPSHAEEVTQENTTFLTAFSSNRMLAEEVAALLKNDYIITGVSDDIRGAEYATALKNILAIAAGICHGMGYGDNLMAVLAAAAVREMKNFLHVVAPKEREIISAPYMGDLLVTFYSQHSRNRIFGTMIGKGYTVKSAQLEMNMIAEGYYASEPLHQLSQEFGINMPVCSAVYNILYNDAEPHREIQQLVFNLH